MSALPQLAPQIGTVVGDGRFVLGELLGEGGVARVYQADDRELGRAVALKLLVERYRGRPEREQRLLNEIEFLRQIGQTSHVVALVGGGRLSEFGGWPFVVTELLEGRTLTQHKLAVRSHSVRRVCSLARQIAEGIRACHRAGVVHRDITPANLMVRGDPRDESSTIKLFDFSHAAWVDGPKVPVGHPDRFTRELEVPGTPKHMSPEQARVEPAAPAMDVYAFGVVLWEMITGENPFGHVRDRQEFIQMQRSGALETPRMMAWTYEIPEDLAALINACLEPDANHRPTMNSIVQRLDGLLEVLQIERPVDSTKVVTWGGAPVEITATALVPAEELVRARGGRPAAEPDGDDEPTQRRDFQPPRRPAFARAHAALVAPPIIAPESTTAPEPEPSEDPGPRSHPRWLPFALVGTAAVGLALWLALENGDRSDVAEPVRTEALPAEVPVVLPAEPTTGREEPPAPNPEQSAADASPVEEPTVSPESDDDTQEPEPRVRNPNPQPKPPALATGPDHETAECTKVREDASVALAATAWAKAEKLTRQAKCWASSTERLRIRVQALAQAERYDACVEAGDGQDDKEIRKWVSICRRAQP